MTMHIFRKNMTPWASSFMLYLGPRIPAYFSSSFSIPSTLGEKLFSFSVEMWHAQHFTTPCLTPISLGRSESSSWELNRASLVSTISPPSLCGGTKSVGRMVGLWVSTFSFFSLYLILFVLITFLRCRDLEEVGRAFSSGLEADRILWNITHMNLRCSLQRLWWWCQASTQSVILP